MLFLQLWFYNLNHHYLFEHYVPEPQQNRHLHLFVHIPDPHILLPDLVFDRKDGSVIIAYQKSF